MKRNRAGKAEVTATGQPSMRQWLAVTALAIAIAVWLKVPSALMEHQETDERIYWQLAENLVAGRGYTLQGTALLQSLSPHVYDRPLFHHPPLFTLTLVPFAAFGVRPAAIVVSWTGQVLSMLAVALIGWRTMRQSPGHGTAMSPGFWLPLVAMASDPLLGFTASRLWIDSLLTGLVAMAFAALVMARGTERSRMWLATAGTFVGLAGLTKLTALIVLPVFVGALVRREGPWRSRLTSLAWTCVPVGILVVPWLLFFRLKCGIFVPDWVAPDLWLREHSAFVDAALNRPWYYYVVKLPLLLPMAAIAVWMACVPGSLRANETMRIATAWCVTVVVALTLLSATGYGFQMRHVAPAVVPLYVAVMTGLLEGGSPTALLACGCAFAVGAFTAGLHVLAQVDEMFSLAEIARLIGF